MRIISDFHDYYDYLQKYDEDRQTLFIRKYSIEYQQNHSLNGLPPVHIYNTKYGIPSFGYIGFCGKKYPYVKFLSNTEYYYDIQSLKNTDIDKVCDIKRVAKFLETNIKESDWPNPIYHVYNSYYNGPRMVIETNCPLKDKNFFKVLDAYSAYQELSMWFNNKATPEKPIPKLDDITMRDIKGFDKYSFRKDKSK